jgi:glycosyltransferase involved in cell wall biosynthesis
MGAGINARLHNVSGPPLDRALAANAGLAQCTGEFALMLDDDDTLDPEHIQILATTLIEHPTALASYTGVRLVDRQGKVLREVNEEWEPDRLLGMNFLPIHAVMFGTSGANWRSWVTLFAYQGARQLTI